MSKEVFCLRIWHKDLIDVLPRQQLISQLRECVAIAKSININNTPNHILVNRVMNYPIEDFNKYCNIVIREILYRNYNIKQTTIEKLGIYTGFDLNGIIDYNIFINWHNHLYLRECLYNLEEKAICKQFTVEDWTRIYIKYNKKFDLWDGTD